MALPFAYSSFRRAHLRRRQALAFIASLFVSLPFVSGLAQIPRGVFSLKGANNHALPPVLANPDVLGLSTRQDWSQLEPNECDFQWKFLCDELQAATDNNKLVFLRINTQEQKPGWVTDAVLSAGGTFFSFDGGSKTIPVFWDPTYLAKKKAMIAALGAKFTSNPALKIVWVSFANAESEDWNVPHGVDDVRNWLDAGYTTEKLVDAGQQLIDATMAAFPNQYVALAIGGNGHSDDPSRPNLDATATEVAATTISMTQSKWPGRLIVQINSLSTFNPAPPGEDDTVWNTLWNSRPDIGAQMLFNVSKDMYCRLNQGDCSPGPAAILTTAINSGVSYGVDYIEIYEADVIALPSVITYARQQLAPSPTPTPTPAPTPIPFNLDGQLDAAGYLQDSTGMTLSAAVRGGALYLATSSPGSDGSLPNDNMILVTDALLSTASQPAPWKKSGMVASDFAKPFLAGESTSTLVGWFNAMVSARATKSAGGDGLMEGTLDLAATFGSIPATVYVAAAAYETADGGNLVAQVPFGNGDGNLDPGEFLPLSILALKDENADGVYDRLDPALGFGITQITRTNGVTTITWASVPGRTYQAEACDTPDGEWMPLNSPLTAGTGALTLTTSDPTDLLTRFYRVRLVNP